MSKHYEQLQWLNLDHLIQFCLVYVLIVSSVSVPSVVKNENNQKLNEFKNILYIMKFEVVFGVMRAVTINCKSTLHSTLPAF